MGDASFLYQAKQQGRTLFLPYFCVGYPSFEESCRLARSALSAGAHGLEVGLPFSDPIADGPTLQRVTFSALSRGTRVSDAFQMLRRLSPVASRRPLFLMTYANPVEAMGFDVFLKRALCAGAAGLIVPDYSLEELEGLSPRARRIGVPLIPFLAPTSSPSRVRRVDALRAPFVYYVSVTGVTGERKNLDPALRGNLVRLKGFLKTPLVVGFGISTPKHAAALRGVADGVIIASALIRVAEKAPRRRRQEAVARFCRAILQSLKEASPRKEKHG